jgi:hypothetical protein
VTRATQGQVEGKDVHAQEVGVPARRRRVYAPLFALGRGGEKALWLCVVAPARWWRRRRGRGSCMGSCRGCGWRDGRHGCRCRCGLEERVIWGLGCGAACCVVHCRVGLHARQTIMVVAKLGALVFVLFMHIDGCTHRARVGAALLHSQSVTRRCKASQRGVARSRCKPSGLDEQRPCYPRRRTRRLHVLPQADGSRRHGRRWVLRHAAH